MMSMIDATLFGLVMGFALSLTLPILLLCREMWKPTFRPQLRDVLCPNCRLNYAIVYDQEHDCCVTCKTKWSA